MDTTAATTASAAATTSGAASHGTARSLPAGTSGTGATAPVSDVSHDIGDSASAESRGDREAVASVSDVSHDIGDSASAESWGDREAVASVSDVSHDVGDSASAESRGDREAVASPSHRDTTQSTPEDLNAYMLDLGARARAAATALARAPTEAKNAALLAVADAILDQSHAIRSANRQDLDRGRSGGLAAPLLDRLELTDARIRSMAEGLRQIATLPDPVGEIGEMRMRPSGLQVGRMRVPLGVIGIIYESRPNVTADAAGLCLKSGNATILRGGSEALASNLAIAGCIHEGLAAAGLPRDAVQVVETSDRAAVGILIAMDSHVDVIVPRGGKGLIERIGREARVPIIKHLDGNCHVFIDDHADPDMALTVAFNAKTYRYGICGAMETLLVGRGIASRVLPALAERLADAGVEIRGCEETRALVADAVPVTEADWETEFLAAILAVRVVGGIDEAMAHIERYGSGHTDAIVTGDLARARRFMTEVDSSSVMVNAPTCFADGFEYGLGAEIGISTDKLHARGPVGLEGLTTRKFIVLGNGQVRG